MGLSAEEGQHEWVHYNRVSCLTTWACTDIHRISSEGVRNIYPMPVTRLIERCGIDCGGQDRISEVTAVSALGMESNQLIESDGIIDKLLCIYLTPFNTSHPIQSFNKPIPDDYVLSWPSFRPKSQVQHREECWLYLRKRESSFGKSTPSVFLGRQLFLPSSYSF